MPPGAIETAATAPMLYRTRVPAAPLDAFVASIWICRNEPGPRRLERILPSGAAQLLVNLKEDVTRSYTAAGSCVTAPGAILSGVATRFQIIDTVEQEHIVGVTFRPGGTVAFFAAPADGMSDSDVPLDALWGAVTTAALRDALLASPDPDHALAVNGAGKFLQSAGNGNRQG